MKPGVEEYTAKYKIELEGVFTKEWANEFSEALSEIEYTRKTPPTTYILCDIPDQARLRGILTKLWDLNITVISFNRQIGI